MNYIYRRKEAKRAESLPKKGTWLPISIASYLKGYRSQQMVRFLYLLNKVRGIQFLKGPLLVCLEDIPQKKIKK